MDIYNFNINEFSSFSDIKNDFLTIYSTNSFKLLIKKVGEIYHFFINKYEINTITILIDNTFTKILNNNTQNNEFIYMIPTFKLSQKKIINFKFISSDVEPAKVEPAKAEPAKVEPAKAEPAKVEPPKVEPPKVEPAKVEPAKAEPAKAEPAKAEPTKVEPAKAESSKVEPSKAEPAKAEPTKAEPPKVEPAKAEPTEAEPTGLDLVRVDFNSTKFNEFSEVETESKQSSWSDWITPNTMVAAASAVAIGAVVVTSINDNSEDDESKRSSYNLLNWLMPDRHKNAKTTLRKIISGPCSMSYDDCTYLFSDDEIEDIPVIKSVSEIEGIVMSKLSSDFCKVYDKVIAYTELVKEKNKKVCKKITNNKERWLW